MRSRLSSYRPPTAVGWFAAVLIALMVVPSHARAAGLLVADGGFGGKLEVKEHNVSVTINNGIAVTTVDQIFLNTENRQVEALYSFPVPKGASVANFSMWINGKEMVGEVLEKQRARAVYNSYKETRRDPGLLEQVNYRTFEMRIFPIAAQAEQRVRITYYQELDLDHDWATYVYPLATTTRKEFAGQRTTGKFALTLDAKSDIPITTIESPSHAKDFAVAKHSESYVQASLETRGGDLNRDIVLAYHLNRPRTGIDVLTSRQNGEDGYFCLTLTAGEDLAGKAPQGMDYLFLLDISGSMNDDNKLDLSKNSLAAFVKSLGTDDRFDVMSFNVQPQPLFKQLSPATEDARVKATEFVNAQRAAGGTVLLPALDAAYRYAAKDRPLNVVILSDGMTEPQERANLIKGIRNRPQNSRVFCIGVGNDVDRSLLEQMANDSGGLAAFLSREDNFDRQAQAFRRKLTKPVATEIKIDLAGIDAYDIEPQKLPNLYHGSPVRMYGRYRKAGMAKVTLNGQIGGIALNRAVDIDFPKEDLANPQIERMWAYNRVQRLLKSADAEGDGKRSGVAAEIVSLGEQYSIVTEYTSFLVLENDAEYARWKILRRNAERSGRDRVSLNALAADLAAIRNKARTDIGPDAVTAPVLASSAAPANASPSGAAPNASTPLPGAPASARRQSGDVGGRSGGGAFDPISGAVVLVTGVVLFILPRRRIANR